MRVMLYAVVYTIFSHQVIFCAEMVNVTSESSRLCLTAARYLAAFSYAVMILNLLFFDYYEVPHYMSQ